MSSEGSLTERYGLDGLGRERRKAFLNLAPEDEALLDAVREGLLARSESFVERFYEHLMRFDETRALLMAEPGRVERLREIQRRYFERLLAGDYGEAYFEERLRVGTAHQRVGLEPQWYLGAFCLYLQLNLPVVLDLCGDDRERAAATIAALVKIVFLDLGLAIDTYIAASRAALEDARDYLDRLFQSISDGLIVLGADGVIRDVNPALLALTGLSREDLVGKRPHRLFADTGAREIRQILDRVASAGSFDEDRLLRHRQGEPIPVACSHSVIRDRRGTVTGFVCALRDMRERRRLLAAVEESRAFLARVLESISDGLVVMTPEGVVSDVNAALLALTGYEREEIIGRPVWTLWGEKDPGPLRERMARIGETGSLHDDRLLFPKEGQPIPVAFSGAAIRDPKGGILGYVGIARDMREQRRLMEALEESRSHFERVLTSISDGLLVLDPEGRIRDVNPVMLAMTGYDRQELLGQSAMTLWRDEPVAAFRRRLSEEVRLGAWHDDRYLYPKRGKPIPVAFSGAPIRDRQGELRGYVGIARDMSERNRLLAELEQAKATLEQRVEERTRELREAQARLFQAEKLSAIGQLAAGIAHEIGTPLNIISGRAEYLLDELGPGDPRASSLKVIVAQIDRIAGLIEQLLDFARTRTDEMGPVRIQRALDSLTPLLDGRLRKLGTTLHAEIGHLPDVYGNFNRLQQVFLNLIVNAVDAICEVRPNGPGRIVVDGDVDGDEVVIRVSDDGCGIPEAHLSRVFDPFFTTKPVGKGTGLGLSVTYGLVREMGGTIRVESREGKGSTFYLRLRRAEPAQTP